MSLDLEKIQGAVTLYRQRRAGVFQVQPMCKRGRFGLADAGQPTSVQPEDDTRLHALLEQALDSFAGNTFGMDSPKFSSKEHAQFVREHDAIMIVRRAEGLELIPWERVRGGFTSIEGASVMLQPSFTAGALADAVREAFRRASER